MFKIENLNVFYGAIHALKDISLCVNKGEIITLIGSNGAGKSTTLKAISGLIPSKSGSITFEGENFTKLPPMKVVSKGIVHVPEGRRIFTDMTVRENLQMGAYLRKDRAKARDDRREIYDLFPILGKRRDQLAGTLSGGEQQMLAMGRAMMSQPKLLLLDEPSMGLSPLLVDEIFALIKKINSSGTTILLVEQNANVALSIANRAYILETGRVVMEGDAKVLAKNDEVKKAYLGG